MERDDGFEHRCTVENAPRVLDWIRNRGGVAIWQSVDLGDPSFSVSTPRRHINGDLVTKPHWKVGEQPAAVVTDPAKVLVFEAKEVKRFHVAVRRGSGLSVTLTDASDRRLKRELQKAGEDAFYTFDYGTQDAVVLVPDQKMSLADWAEKHGGR